ncbi:ATP-binding cassette domain-containing protein [Shouchella lonarensis]|uniref:ABC-2 type transport system ATP-binding protein n=1 Tax=Shouchella lonarensis TaxID=1464122 RepID=A0A1G6IPQ1_9BACI|nr:ABC transporter ATP-binding protein [Shouchella lonarensis]SDC08479.1 ABC-2 type transport system ATP-binding protein [Shouchella lonarensis]
MIEAKNISLQYGEKEALKNISFTLETDKIYGLLGRNGAGKTSLLSLLAGFQQPTTGHILVDGQDVFENTQTMTKMVFVRPEVFSSGTEERTLEKWLKHEASFRPHYDHHYALQLLERFQLDPAGRIKDLSRGMTAVVTAILGLASRAAVTFFDESYLGMDAPTRDLFYKELLLDYMAHPRTMILSTHLISEMDTLFEEVLIIKQGSLLLHERTEDLLARGTTITGKGTEVDRFIDGKHVLQTEQLGNTKSAMIYTPLSEAEQADACAQNLEIGPMTLQSLFIHLTKEETS